MINWGATKEEYEKISAICKRADDVKRFGMDLQMDMAATHCNGCPLDLEKLLNAPEFDFYHDIYGIINNLNRNTGELENCFLPRCAKPERT